MEWLPAFGGNQLLHVEGTKSAREEWQRLLHFICLVLKPSCALAKSPIIIYSCTSVHYYHQAKEKNEEFLAYLLSDTTPQSRHPQLQPDSSYLVIPKHM